MNRLVMRQTLRYDYPAPIHRLDHHLKVLPPARHGDQVRTESSLEVRGAGADVSESVDAFGNVAVHVRAARSSGHAFANRGLQLRQVDDRDAQVGEVARVRHRATVTSAGSPTRPVSNRCGPMTERHGA